MALAYLTINLDAFTGDDHPPVSSYSTITLDPGADHIDAAADVIHVRTIVVSLDQQGKAATANGVPCVDGKVPVVAGVMYAVLAPRVLRDGPHYIPALTAGQVVDLSDYITPGAPLTPDQAAILTARIEALETTPPRTIAILGDSITENSGTWPARFEAGNEAATSFYNDQRGAIGWALNRLKQPLKFVGDFGVNGDTTAMILARVPDVIALAPGYVVLLGGANDVTYTTPAATIIANLSATVDALTAAGIRVLLGEITPWTAAGPVVANATQVAIITEVNTWVRSQSKAVPVPWAGIMSDPTTGNYLVSAFSTASPLHPNSEGGARMGQVLAEVLSGLVPTIDPFRPAGDPAQVLANPNQVGAGVPTSWAASNAAGATYVQSKVPRTDNKPGEWVQFAVSANGSNEHFYQQIITPLNAKIAAGDYVRGLWEYEISGAGAPFVTCYFKIEFRNAGGATILTTSDNFALSQPPAGAAHYPSSGVMRTPEVQVPALATMVVFRAVMYGVATYRWGRADLRKVAVDQV